MCCASRASAEISRGSPPRALPSDQHAGHRPDVLREPTSRQGQQRRRQRPAWPARSMSPIPSINAARRATGTCVASDMPSWSTSRDCSAALATTDAPGRGARSTLRSDRSSTPRRSGPRAGSASLDALHRLLEAAAHPIEGSAQACHLVAAALGELGHLEVAGAAPGRRRGPSARSGRTMSRLSMTFRVRKSTTKTPTSEAMKVAKVRAGVADRQVHRYRDDLGADDLVQVPAEAVQGPVGLDHQRRGDRRRALTGEAGGIADLDGPGDVERAPQSTSAAGRSARWPTCSAGTAGSARSPTRRRCCAGWSG